VIRILCRTVALATALLLVPLAVVNQGRSQPPQGQGGRQGGPAQAAQPLPPDAPFTVAVATSTLEAAPVYLAVARGGPANYRFVSGGVRSLLNGGAHGATNAETQMLLAIDANPKIRMLFTLTEGLYRLVAKRSSGIRTVADLKGKRVVVPRNTSAHYFLVRMLTTAGLQEHDVTLVAAPATEMALALVRGEADAISMWEPESQNAVDALGTDAIVFPGKGVYREGFSFYSSTDVLNDSRRRQELVAFVRAVFSATGAIKARPAEFFSLISRVTRHPVEEISRSWEHHAFPLVIPDDMLDVVTEEEKWIARGQNREPRTRAQLQTYFDRSIVDEARRGVR
jgi:sulfonate transport system substrate-binding protein